MFQRRFIDVGVVVSVVVVVVVVNVVDLIAVAAFVAASLSLTQVSQLEASAFHARYGGDKIFLHLSDKGLLMSVMVRMQYGFANK